MAGFVQAENVYLAPQALESDVNIAWMFIEFLLRPELQAVLADLGTIPAMTPEAFTTSRILIRDDLIEQAILALANGITYPVVPEIFIYQASLDAALQSVFFDEVAPQTALQMAEETIIQASSSLDLGISTPP